MVVKIDFSCGDCYVDTNSKPILVYIEGLLAHYIIQELRISDSYRKQFITAVKKRHTNKITFILRPTQREIIDYAWNQRTNHIVWERLELDHVLSWLSTLGGAFSALGDYFPDCAEMAGKISLHQFNLALKLHDPNIEARCRLFMSLSLIQQGYLKLARKIIYKEYHCAKNSIVIDTRLVRMCLGIWAKLQYEYNTRRRIRR